MHYRIRVKGHLDPSWQSWFAGLEIEQHATGTTFLSESLPDQAVLFGVLLKIERLGLTLLGLEGSDTPTEQESVTRLQTARTLSLNLEDNN